MSSLCEWISVIKEPRILRRAPWTTPPGQTLQVSLVFATSPSLAMLIPTAGGLLVDHLHSHQRTHHLAISRVRPHYAPSDLPPPLYTRLAQPLPPLAFFNSVLPLRVGYTSSVDQTPRYPPSRFVRTRNTTNRLVPVCPRHPRPPPR